MSKTNILAVNEFLTAFDDLVLARELAIRKALRFDEHKAANKAQALLALDTLFDLSFHRPGFDCDDENLIPMDRMVQRGDGFNTIACPACYLGYLTNDFDGTWNPDFMVQLKVADYAVGHSREERVEREEHIDLVLSNLDVLLPLTFHPNREGCTDMALLPERQQFRRGDRGQTDVTCPRCFLLTCQQDADNWDPRFQLRVHLWNVPPVYIPGE